jgi:hypothetical protein
VFFLLIGRRLRFAAFVAGFGTVFVLLATIFTVADDFVFGG